MGAIDPHVRDDVILLKIPKKVSFSVLDFLIKETRNKYKAKGDVLINYFIVDFSLIEFIDAEGALALICFCASIKEKTKRITFSFIYPKEKVLFYLIAIGFFSQMSKKVGIIERQDIINYEKKLMLERDIKRRLTIYEDKLVPIILPIETIPQYDPNISGRDFEKMSISFVNHTISVFQQLFSSDHYNFTGWDQNDFLLSNRELYRNIFEHSTSWGIAIIHARPFFGTLVCYFDIGIGFKKSIGKFTSDSESIEWALVDGNTSKISDINDGHGLTIVQNFITRRNGYLKIRSGESLLEINSHNRKYDKVSSFPGVQMSFFIPV